MIAGEGLASRLGEIRYVFIWAQEQIKGKRRASYKDVFVVGADLSVHGAIWHMWPATTTAAALKDREQLV